MSERRFRRPRASYTLMLVSSSRPGPISVQAIFNPETKRFKLNMTRDLRIAGILLGFAAACGGSSSTDYNSNFTGTWRGNLTTTIGTSSTTQPVTQLVNAISTNRLRFEDSYCPTNGTADSASHVGVDTTNCPNATSGGCTYRVTITSGNFNRDGSGARMTFAGQYIVVSGCAGIPDGTSFPYSAASDLMTRQ